CGRVSDGASKWTDRRPHRDEVREPHAGTDLPSRRRLHRGSLTSFRGGAGSKAEQTPNETDEVETLALGLARRRTGRAWLTGRARLSGLAGLRRRTPLTRLSLLARSGRLGG